jgi:hypothetical protein
MDYDWLGYGLRITWDGGDLFMQGEEASELHDQLEACETQEEVDLILSEYADVIEED